MRPTVPLERVFELGMDRKIQPWLSASWQEGTEPEGLQVNLGGGHRKPMPTGTIDVGFPTWDAESDPLPFPDESVAVIWSLHFFEHIDNFLPLLRECERVLSPGGVLNIVVPYGSGHLAVQDPTHKRFFNEDTWRTLFHNSYYNPAGDWKFSIETNVIMGVTGQNLALVTQLMRTP
jgi:SAM-dependent methyltransferase